jgi:AraC family transcriptional regulator
MEIPDHAPLQDAFVIVHSPSKKVVKRILDGRLNEEIDEIGDVIQTPSGFSHSVAWDNKAAFSVMAFEQGYLASLGHDIYNPNRFQLPPRFARKDPIIYGIAQSLKDWCDSDTPVSQLYLDSIGVFLASHLVANYPIELELSGGFTSRDFHQIVDYVHANLSKKIGLAELSALIGMSQSYFFGLFKKTTGKTPHQYVMQCRLLEAKKLLKKTDLTIEKISQVTGFTNKSHLCASFRKHLSVSPMEYRKLL